MAPRAWPVVILVSAALTGGYTPSRATAGLPGYFEWVLWKDVLNETPRGRDQTRAELEWIVGPYAKLSDCEQDRDRLAEATARSARLPSGVRGSAPNGFAVVTADKSTIRFFCVPDGVNPRVDRRWP
jgi:hypothetical protein